MAMKDILAIKKLSRAEKLRVMEALWEDLCREDQSIQSPAWHESVLRETEERVQTGQEKILDWKVAKRELRKRFE